MSNMSNQIDSLTEDRSEIYHMANELAKTARGGDEIKGDTIKSRLKQCGIDTPLELKKAFNLIKENRSQLKKILIDNHSDKNIETQIRTKNPNYECAHTTALWIVTGEYRNRLADIIFAKLVQLDVCVPLNNEVNLPYRVTSHPSLRESLYDYNSDVSITDCRNIWLLMIRDWDNIVDKASKQIESLVKDRKDIATTGTSHPTIITINDELVQKSFFAKAVNNNTFNANIKVIRV